MIETNLSNDVFMEIFSNCFVGATLHQLASPFIPFLRLSSCLVVTMVAIEWPTIHALLKVNTLYKFSSSSGLLYLSG